MNERVGQVSAAGATAWHAPDADAHWYPIATMRWAGVPVIVALDGGERAVAHQVLAIVRRHGQTKRLWWYQIGVWAAAGWARREEIRLEAYGRETPARFSPIAWRPVDRETWPHPLPDPLWPAMGPNRPLPPARDPVEPLDPHVASDGWPYPDLVLGIGMPKSREECEARVLRAFRTSAAQARIGHRGSGGFSADIPSEMIVIALKNAAREREAEERRAGMLANPLDAVRSGWTPTRRDVDDWVTALGWLNHTLDRERRAVELRAADPPWSFVQIAKALGVKRNVTARNIYDTAIDWAFRAATQAAAPAPSAAETTALTGERA